MMTMTKLCRKLRISYNYIAMAYSTILKIFDLSGNDSVTYLWKWAYVNIHQSITFQKQIFEGLP